MRVAFFEDRAAEDFAPLALTRPVFEMVCGRFSMRERVVRLLGVSDWGAIIRSYLEEPYREAFPEAHVNDLDWLGEDRTLLLNGRWLPSREALLQIRDEDAGVLNETPVYLTLSPVETDWLRSAEFTEGLDRLVGARHLVQTTGRLMQHPWDPVRYNAKQLKTDFREAVRSPESGVQTDGCDSAQFNHVAVLGSKENVSVDPSSAIDPFVVLDARHGPISIDAGAVIGSFTHIEGPCHIGHGSQLFGAQVRGGTTIGPVCRVGGEIETSILHEYVNKYHTGFLGHSYVCPWVNLGALTTNSDLKNDYGTVHMPNNEGTVDTGLTKMGCLIGDHTKTAIGCLLNTGTSFGVMSMILPDGKLLPKDVPSFARVWHGQLDDGLDLNRAIETARTVMGRRNVELTPAQQRLVRFLYEHTRPYRERAVIRFQERKRQRAESLHAGP